MTVDEVVDQLAPWLARNTRTAWRPLVRDGDGQPSAISKFGGAPWLSKREKWPLCGACRRKMRFFLQLDLAHLPSDWGGRPTRGLLQFFYCTHEECEVSRNAWDPFDSGQLVRIVVPDKRAQSSTAQADPDAFPAKVITGWEPVADLPHNQDHDELGLRYLYDFDAKTTTVDCDDPKVTIALHIDATSKDGLEVAEAIGRCITGDKLAGWPDWIQGAEYPSCPKCAARMTMLVQIASEDNVPFMFGDVGVGHITQCPNHPQTLAFGWSCH